MELEPGNPDFKPMIDRRRHMPEPPAVQLIAVDDVTLECAAGIERELDAFYVAILAFEREGASEGRIAYRGGNFRIRFTVLEPPLGRADMRPTPIAVPSLPATRAALIEQEIEHVWQKGIAAGADTILLQDPARNWVELSERREVG